MSKTKPSPAFRAVGFIVPPCLSFILLFVAFHVPYFGYNVLELGRSLGIYPMMGFCIGVGVLFMLRENLVVKIAYVLLMIPLICFVLGFGLILLGRS